MNLGHNRTVPYLAMRPREKQAISPVSYWWTWTGSNRRPLPCHVSDRFHGYRPYVHESTNIPCGPDVDPARLGFGKSGRNYDSNCARTGTGPDSGTKRYSATNEGVFGSCGEFARLNLPMRIQTPDKVVL